MPTSNPFRLGEHVSGDYFTNREEEVGRIRTAIVESSVFLFYGPRRVGKSSAVRAAARLAATSRPRPIVIMADLSTTTSLFDLSGRLLRSLFQETRFLKMRIEEILGGLGPLVTVTFECRLRRRRSVHPVSQLPQEPLLDSAGCTIRNPTHGAGLNRMTIKARVRRGRLLVDEPTELPEGTEIELLPLDPGDWLDEEDRAALHEALRQSDADVAAGRLADAETILREIKKP